MVSPLTEWDMLLVAKRELNLGLHGAGESRWKEPRTVDDLGYHFFLAAMPSVAPRRRKGTDLLNDLEQICIPRRASRSRGGFP